MRISDWSSDVCSSDLVCAEQTSLWLPRLLPMRPKFINTLHGAGTMMTRADKRSEERRVGKECAVRVDLGGRRIIKKKKRSNGVGWHKSDTTETRQKTGT